MIDEDYLYVFPSHSYTGLLLDNFLAIEEVSSKVEWLGASALQTTNCKLLSIRIHAQTIFWITLSLWFLIPFIHSLCYTCTTVRPFFILNQIYSWHSLQRKRKQPLIQTSSILPYALMNKVKAWKQSNKQGHDQTNSHDLDANTRSMDSTSNFHSTSMDSEHEDNRDNDNEREHGNTIKRNSTSFISISNGIGTINITQEEFNDIPPHTTRTWKVQSIPRSNHCIIHLHDIMKGTGGIIWQW